MKIKKKIEIHQKGDIGSLLLLTTTSNELSKVLTMIFISLHPPEVPDKEVWSLGVRISSGVSSLV